MSEGMVWENIPQTLLDDCAQLVKANSIEGNKKDDLTIIYTPAANLKKSGDMAVGQVSFHNDKKVKRVHVARRENVIVNRINKTKVEREVDHEQERVDRIKRENAGRRAAAAEKVSNHFSHSFLNSTTFPEIEKARYGIGESERSRKGRSIVWFFV